LGKIIEICLEIFLLKTFLIIFLLSEVGVYWRRRPALPPALLLFIASVFLSRVYWKIAGTTIRFEQLTALLLFACFVLDLLRKKILFRLRWQVVLVLALFPLMLLSSFLASPAPWLSLKKSLVYLPYLLAFLAMVHYLSSAEKLQETWQAFYFFGAAAVSLSVIGFYLFYFGINVGMVRSEYGSLWLRGTMVAPNIMGSSAVIVFLAALLRLTGAELGQAKERVMDMAVLAASIAAVMMSYSRGAWLGAFLGMIVVIVLRRRKLVVKSSALLPLIMVGSCILVSLTTTWGGRLGSEEKNGISMGEFGEASVDVVLRQDSDSKGRGVNYLKKIKSLKKIERQDRWRFHVAREALKDWRFSPIIGRGTDSLQFRNERFLPIDKFNYYIAITVLSILHDWGGIGLLLYCAFLLAALLGLARIFRSHIGPKQRESALALLVVLIVSTFMYQISSTMQLSIFWCLFAFYASAIFLGSHGELGRISDGSEGGE
jgi:hypothetical protein